MEEIALLTDLLIVFGGALVSAVALHRIGLPPLAGFIVAGTLVGPRSLGLIADVHEVEMLAEIGVALLLFGIGLELSLKKLRRLWRIVLIGGSLQVSLTTAATAAICLAFAMPLNSALFVGCMVAVSSTAIVLRGLEYRGEIDAPHGRFILGILVFQDLCVVPMMLAVPLLAAEQGSGRAALLALLAAAAVLVGTLFAAQFVVPRLLRIIARTRQRDLFVLAVLLVCIGTAWTVSKAGVSLALGAFLAGLVVAGSEYRHQAMSDVIPFREVFSSLFFVSVGMLLDPVALVDSFVSVAGLLLLILMGKFAIVFLVGLLMRLPPSASLISGITLAQTGEFLFVLLRSARGTGLAEGAFTDDLSLAAILSMLVTPPLMWLSPRVAAGLGRVGRLRGLFASRAAESQGRDPSPTLRQHVIVAGYGVTGQELARSLREVGVGYVIVDMNAETVRRIIGEGEKAYFGDITSPALLEKLGIGEAGALVIAISDHGAAERAVRQARHLATELPIIVRSRYVAEVDDFFHAGATIVVPAEFEAAVEITAQVLAGQNVEPGVVESHVARLRAQCKASRKA
jgi:CPA2 family monovalent cation:H+ antiporter-2